jgi:tetratricopeptide (TPR) repeat protein
MEGRTMSRPERDFLDVRWTEEQVTWRDYYLRQLNEQLARATELAQQPERLAPHAESLFMLLRSARAYPQMASQTIALIAALGVWPARWGYWQAWEDMLGFGISVTGSHQDAVRHSAFLIELGDLLLNTGRLEEAMNVGQRVLDLSEAAQTPTHLARAASLLVQLHARQGGLEAAYDILDRAEAKLERTVDASAASVYLHISRAVLARRSGRLGDAWAWADRAVQFLVHQHVTDPQLLGDAYHFRGTICWVRGQYAAAAVDMGQAATLYSQTGDRYAVASVQGNLGLVYWSMGELDQAERLFEYMVLVAREQGARWQEAVHVGNLGLVALSRGRLEHALAFADRHLALASRNLDKHEVARAHGIRGTVSLHRGDFAAAATDLLEEQAFHNEYGGREGLIINYVSHASCLVGLKRADEALALARQALASAREIGSLPLQVIALRSLAQQLPAPEQAPHLRAALKLAQQMGRRLDEAACLLSLSRLAAETDRARLWRRGERLLKRMDAAAWLGGHSIDDPPEIVLSG